MRNFQTKMALLVFSFFFAGCTTPFVEVTVSDGFSAPQQDGGACPYPCFCPTCGGGGKFRSSNGHEAKILHVEKAQVVYTLEDGEGNFIRLVNPTPPYEGVKIGDSVKIKKEGTVWSLAK